jgi:hypothetical protein
MQLIVTGKVPRRKSTCHLIVAQFDFQAIAFAGDAAMCQSTPAGSNIKATVKPQLCSFGARRLLTP